MAKKFTKNEIKNSIIFKCEGMFVAKRLLAKYKKSKVNIAFVLKSVFFEYG